MQPQPNQKPTSELQEKILKHICITANADYKTISKETDRDRITILQSLKPLIRHRYIRPVKLNPKQAKSKLTFKPTDKGTMYSIAYMGVDIDAIRRAQLPDNVLESHKVFEQEIPSLGVRKQFEQHIGPKLFV